MHYKKKFNKEKIEGITKNFEFLVKSGNSAQDEDEDINHFPVVSTASKTMFSS